MVKTDFQRVADEAVKMAEKIHSDPVIVAAVAQVLIETALRPYEHALRYELLHGKDQEVKSGGKKE